MYQICLSWLYTWIYILIFGGIEIVKDDKKRMKGVSHFFFGQGGGGVSHWVGEIYDSKIPQLKQYQFRCLKHYTLQEVSEDYALEH